MKTTTSEVIFKSGIPRKQYYEIIAKYPQAKELMLKGVLCDKLINSNLIDVLIKNKKV